MAPAVLLTTMTLLLLTAMTSVVTSRSLEVRDLTHTLGTDSLFWPGQPPFNFTVLHRGHWRDTETWVEMNAFGLGEHGGTHIDAPAHFAKGRWHAEEIPASHLAGPGLVLDVTEKVKVDETYAVTTEDFLQWEAEHGRIPDRAVVLINAGWGKRYPDPKRVFNTEHPDNPDTFRFPGMRLAAARWLVEKRNVTAVGVDTPNPEEFGTSDLPVHVKLLSSDILILEYVANMDTLPPRGFDVIIGSVKLRDGSGGPARILALMGDSGSGAAARAAAEVSRSLVLAMALMLSLWNVPILWKTLH